MTIKRKLQTEYRCSVEIEVTADSPEEAAEMAWKLLSDKDALLPVVKVSWENNVPLLVDLSTK